MAAPAFPMTTPTSRNRAFAEFFPAKNGDILVINRNDRGQFTGMTKADPNDLTASSAATAKAVQKASHPGFFGL